MNAERTRPQGTLPTIADLHTAMQHAAQHGLVVDFDKLNDPFHRAIIPGAQNPSIARMHEIVMRYVYRARHRANEHDRLPMTAAEHHSAIVQQISVGEPMKACSSMRALLEEVAGTVLDAGSPDRLRVDRSGPCCKRCGRRPPMRSVREGLGRAGIQRTPFERHYSPFFNRGGACKGSLWFFACPFGWRATFASRPARSDSAARRFGQDWLSATARLRSRCGLDRLRPRSHETPRDRAVSIDWEPRSATKRLPGHRKRGQSGCGESGVQRHHRSAARLTPFQ